MLAGGSQEMSIEFIRKAYQIDVKAGDRIEFRDYLGKIKLGTVSRGFGWLLRVRIDGRDEPVNVHPQNVLRVVKKGVDTVKRFIVD
jgi:hypothetical protein